MADEKPSTSATLGASSPVTDIITPNIHLPPKLELSRNLIANWKRFKCLLMNYKITSRLQTQGKDLHVAMLLTYTRPDIYDHLPFTSKDDTSNIGKVLELLEQYCIDETNKTYERYVFNKCDHQQSHLIHILPPCVLWWRHVILASWKTAYYNRIVLSLRQQYKEKTACRAKINSGEMH